jgi:hypothetical protein
MGPPQVVQVVVSRASAGIVIVYSAKQVGHYQVSLSNGEEHSIQKLSANGERKHLHPNSARLLGTDLAEIAAPTAKPTKKRTLHQVHVVNTRP